MSLEHAVEVLNRMVDDGIISSYAIGGAVGAMFYVEPVNTEDLDIYVDFPKGQLIVSLEPIYSYLESIGFGERRGLWVIIDGTPVQFLPIEGPLLEDASKHALSLGVGQEEATVFSQEYIVALAVQLARANKDIPRIKQFVEERAVNRKKLATILRKHSLFEKYKRIERGFRE